MSAIASRDRRGSSLRHSYACPAADYLRIHPAETRDYADLKLAAAERRAMTRGLHGRLPAFCFLCPHAAAALHLAHAPLAETSAGFALNADDPMAPTLHLQKTPARRRLRTRNTLPRSVRGLEIGR